jgi:hypothetical protein
LNLSAKIDAFRESPSFSPCADDDARVRISALEEQVQHHDLQLQMIVDRFSDEVARLDAEIDRIRASVGAMPDLGGVVEDVRVLRETVDALAVSRTEERAEMRAEVEKLKASAKKMVVPVPLDDPEPVRQVGLRPPSQKGKKTSDTEIVWTQPAPAPAPAREPAGSEFQWAAPAAGVKKGRAKRGG